MSRPDKFWAMVGELISGEWMFWGGRPNGGTVILCRSLQIALMFYLIGLWLRSIFSAAHPWTFDLGGLWHNGAETVPWLGALVGAVYAALYARFAAQWSYLAGFANQLMQTRSSVAEPTSSITTWEAAFVEDAVNLHLATKPMFSVLVWLLLADPHVAERFKAYTVDGDAYYGMVRAVLRKQVGSQKLSEIEAKDAALYAAQRGQRGKLMLLCANHHNGRIVGVLEQGSAEPGSHISYVRENQPDATWPLDTTGRFVEKCSCGATVGDLVSAIQKRLDEVVADTNLTRDVYYLRRDP